MCVYTHYILLFLVDGHLHCFHVLAILNSAAVDIRCMYLFELQVSLSVCPGLGCWSYGSYVFSFIGIFILFFIIVPIYIPTNSSLFFTPSPAFIICRLLDKDHSDWYELVPHCIFDLLFSNY